MEPSAGSRARMAITFVVTAIIVSSEFALLMVVNHLGDDVDRQQVAQAQVTGAVSTWQPGDDTASVERAVRAFDATGADEATSVRAATQVWAQRPSPSSFAQVRTANTHAAAGLDADQRSVERRTMLILASLLIAVSIGWFVWFRQLVRRHRALQQAVTERQVLDSGERRLLALVRNSADLVVVLEPDSTASFVSPSSTSVLGLAPESLTGTRFVDVLLPADVPLFIRMLAGSWEGEQALMLRTRHADGRDLVLEGTLTNLLADEAVTGWVLTVRDVTDREALLEQISYQAFHDTLTGLPNRQLFSDRLAHALRRRGATEPLVVMFLDLDDFKHVNDSLGHTVGDQLLETIAERIGETIRQGDTAARLGGDEFAVLLEDADIDTAREVADRLLEAFAVPVSVNGSSHSIRASIGMTEATPGEADRGQTLRNAEVAMYWAKDRGKGMVAVYEAGLHAEALDRMALRGELQRAIRDEQLVLHYQPTVDLDDQHITGFEALVRWDHPDRGLLPPAEFIRVAEQSGLIVPLGSWVLREACRAGADLQSELHRPTMSVNIAAQQLAKPDFVDEVIEVLHSSGLPADRLVLEITESMLLDDMEHSIRSLARLRARGVRVAIDDFGTGYSSLSYLAQLPVDVLKVDKSFIDQVCGSGGDTSLVEAIIAMSRSMRLVTIAEGVEQPEQAAWLQLARCSMGQGYLWSRPVDLTTARGLLRESPSDVPPVSTG